MTTLREISHVPGRSWIGLGHHEGRNVLVVAIDPQIGGYETPCCYCSCDDWHTDRVCAHVVVATGLLFGSELPANVPDTEGIRQGVSAGKDTVAPFPPCNRAIDIEPHVAPAALRPVTCSNAGDGALSLNGNEDEPLALGGTPQATLSDTDGLEVTHYTRPRDFWAVTNADHHIVDGPFLTRTDAEHGLALLRLTRQGAEGVLSS